ncbi:MAG: chorismate mutase [Anaerolineae bacterium]|jgi:chorismate mutase
MTCRGIRGAICVEANQADAILRASRQLLERVVVANDLSAADVASVIFTATPDLDAAYPARAAREMGWVDIPLLCMQEMAVAGSLPRCIRVLVHWNTDRAPQEMRHVYLGAARALRPDLAEPISDDASSDTAPNPAPDRPSEKEAL